MKHLFIVVLLAFCVTSGWAQMELKPFVGSNVSTFYGNDKKTIGNFNVGFNAGLSFLYGRKFFVEPGVAYGFYKQKAEHYVKDASSFIQKDQEHFLQVPVMFGYHLAGSQRSKCALKLSIGAVYSWLIRTNDAAENDFRNRVGVCASIGVNLGPVFVDLSYAHDVNKFLGTKGIKHPDRVLCAKVGFRLFRRYLSPKEVERERQKAVHEFKQQQKEE